MSTCASMDFSAESILPEVYNYRYMDGINIRSLDF